MVAEILVAGLIGVIGTLLGSFFTYFLDRHREDHARKLEDWNKAVQEVYSPLIFDLRSVKDWGTLQQLRVLDKTIPNLSKTQDEGQLNASLTFLLRITNRKQSQILKDTLRKNVRLIRPKNLWDDLFVFYDTLELIEFNLATFSTGFFERSPKFIAYLKAYAQIGAILDEATEHLLAAIEQLTLLDKPPSFLSYETFFTEDAKKRLVDELDKAPIFSPKDQKSPS